MSCMGRELILLGDRGNVPKEMCRIMNEVVAKDHSSTAHKFIGFESQLVGKPNKIAKAFNIHFTTSGPKLAGIIKTKEVNERLEFFM